VGYCGVRDNTQTRKCRTLGAVGLAGLAIAGIAIASSPAVAPAAGHAATVTASVAYDVQPGIIMDDVQPGIIMDD
jgi:hypothetical protein